MRLALRYAGYTAGAPGASAGDTRLRPCVLHHLSPVQSGARAEHQGRDWEEHGCRCGCPEVAGSMRFRTERLIAEGFFSSFPVFLIPVVVLAFWGRGNFPLYEQNDFTYSRLEAREDCGLHDGDEGWEENIPFQQSLLTVLDWWCTNFSANQILCIWCSFKCFIFI